MEPTQIDIVNLEEQAYNQGKQHGYQLGYADGYSAGWDAAQKALNAQPTESLPD